MQFERLKKSHKKEIIIALIAVCVIGGALTFSLTRAKYKIANDLELAKGIINYKVPDLRVVALYTENDNGYIETNDIPKSGYILNTEKSMCKVYDGTTSIKEAPKDNNVTIEYNSGKVNFLGISKKNTRCYLYFDIDTRISVDDIIASFGSNLKNGIPDFSQVATGAESEDNNGIYIADDPMYGTNAKSYYWRGAATTNYVKFANFCWRIVRINGDKSIRLIYDGVTCHNNGEKTTSNLSNTNVKYNNSYNKSYYAGWTYGTSQRTLNGTASNAKVQLQSWFDNNISNENLIMIDTNAKYCNDRNTGRDSSGNQGTWSVNGNDFYYAGYYRLYVDYIPTLTCDTGDIYALSVGLITADEVMYAGGNNENNSLYYLYNGQDYWTMSPSWWYKQYEWVYAFIISKVGTLTGGLGVGNPASLRPVINLRSDITFSDGDGTLNNPYVVE